MRQTRSTTLPDGPVLLCYDGSAQAVQAIRSAAALTGGGRALALHVWTPPLSLLPPSVTSETFAPLMERVAEQAQAGSRVAAEGAALAAEAGFDAEPLLEQAPLGPLGAILEVAERERAALVVVGRHGGRSLLGSVSRNLARHCPRPLLVSSGPPTASSREELQPLLIGYDGSEGARRAIEWTARLFPGRSALVACVWEPTDRGTVFRAAGSPVLWPELDDLVRDLNRRARRAAGRVAAEGEDFARAAGLDVHSAETDARGPAWRGLARLAAALDPAAVIVGPRRDGAVRSALRQSTSRGLLSSGLPVLLTPSSSAPAHARPTSAPGNAVAPAAA